ncbi:type II restriction endonuclease [Desulfurobacterium sp.]
MIVSPEEIVKMMFSQPEDFLNIFIGTLKKNIYTWNYFVDWKKIERQIKKYEKELNLLNFLVGKDDFEENLKELILEYPSVVKTFPLLLALKSCEEIEIIHSIKDFNYSNFSFSPKQNFSPAEIKKYVKFFKLSGLEEIFKTRIKNVLDYITGIKVGMDTNARKNRTGKLMEAIIEAYLLKLRETTYIDFIPQATKEKIEENWNIEVNFGETKRKIDFAVKSKNKVHFIEVNFYATSGSKLKSTAGEYRKISQIWKNQGINFIWISDGNGWRSTKNALIEYLKEKNILLNLSMVSDGVLEYIFQNVNNLET